MYPPPRTNSEYTKQYMARMNGEEVTTEDNEATIQFLAAHAPRSKAEAQWDDTGTKFYFAS